MPLVRPFIFMASVKWEWAMEKKWQWRQYYIPLILRLDSPLCLDCSWRIQNKCFLEMRHQKPAIIKTKKKKGKFAAIFE